MNDIYSLIDTHCHLNFKVFRPRLRAVMARAREAGVEQMIVVGTKLKTSARAVHLAQEYLELFASIGIHPHHVWEYLSKAKQQANVTGQPLSELLDLAIDQTISSLLKLTQSTKVIAIGEIGLDYHFYEQTIYQDKELTAEYQLWQERFLVKQAELAHQLGLPMIIHQREAVTDILFLFNKHAYLFEKTRLVLHCCEPDQQLLDWVLAEQNRYLGVDGDVTFDSIKQNFIKQVPLTKLLLETDAPYITPEPDRSLFATQRNKLPYHQRVCEPRHVAVIAQAVAELHQVSLSKVAEQTTNNARLLFDIN